VRTDAARISGFKYVVVVVADLADESSRHRRCVEGRRKGEMKVAPDLAASRAGWRKQAYLEFWRCRAGECRKASALSMVSGTFTATFRRCRELGAILPSLPSKSVAATWPRRPSTVSQISLKYSLIGRPVLEFRVGLVVTPSRESVAARSRNRVHVAGDKDVMRPILLG